MSHKIFMSSNSDAFLELSRAMEFDQLAQAVIEGESDRVRRGEMDASLGFALNSWYASKRMNRSL